MESLENIYRINKERLHSLSIPFREWRHEAILEMESRATLKSRKNSAGKAHIAKACF